MTLRDRGNIKWLGFFMTEHNGMLKQFREEEQKRIPKPDVDPQQFDEFERIICEAMAENLALRFTYWIDYRIEDVIGSVHYIDNYANQFRIVCGNDEVIRLDIARVVDVTTVD
ncbi:YolD-like family protein [Alkalihalobacillus macyae]|uniref:YolD-like family protein n=1 Tax=Guptibacillus hwajinpoensis TaxID=208199 RepID=UPI00273A8367|nr:YolD-like family protein [Alkalihalobacillus macyae]MDP4550872.1 YolD-like family protein [Alkalihalobacillus macyae]